MVSIICNAYNHEQFIRQAIESIMMQQTDFTYEILLHDDASTDKTADVIREYELKYPEIIKPIYQKENQHSKGIKISSAFQYPRVRGKYVAICEGDDYWTDPHKLQKQFDIMELHPEIDICSHTSSRVDAQTGEEIRVISASDQTCVIPTKKVIQGGGGFVSTNTLFYRSNLLQSFPKFRSMMDLDYTIQVHGSMRGGMLFLHDNMSAYRTNVQNSWIARMRSDPRKRRQHKMRSIRVLFQMNKDLKWRYCIPIAGKILKNYVEYIALSFKSFMKYDRGA